MNAMTDFDRRLGDWLEDGPQTVPDWLIEEALGQARATSQLSRRIQVPWTIPPSNRLRLATAIAVVLVALLAIAVGVGSLVPPDAPSRQLIPGGVPACSPSAPVALFGRDPMTIPGTKITVHMPAVQGVMSSGQAAVDGMIGFADGAPGLSYGLEPDPSGVTVSSRARGIVVADVTQAISHAPATGGIRVGTDPATFVAGLRDTIGLAVLDPTAVSVDGHQAISAMVSSDGLRTGSAPGWTHIDRPGLGCVVDFTLPSKITVIDVDGALVLVQVWAANEQELRAWLPTADALLESLRLGRS